ncbi:MAG: hypothetical protein ABJA64_01975 [Candidatus Saccharibacteria bacterium]
MKKFKLTLISLAALIGVGLVPVSFATAAFAAPADEINKGLDATGQKGGSGTDLKSRLATIVNVLLFLIGAISVIVIIIGGIKFVTSDGDPGKAKSARETILYAIVGVVIALLAYALVQFVIKAFV